MDRLNYFKNLLKKDPNNPMVHYSLSFEYYKTKDYEMAIKHMETYMALKEDEGSGYRVLAKCYEELGDYEKAIEVLQKGIQKALKYNHPSMVEEFERWLEQLKHMQSF